MEGFSSGSPEALETEIQSVGDLLPERRSDGFASIG